MQRYEYSLKMNVFFYFKAKEGYKSLYMVLRSIELNLVDRFLYACMPWFTSSSVEHGENLFGLTGAILQP